MTTQKERQELAAKVMTLFSKEGDDYTLDDGLKTLALAAAALIVEASPTKPEANQLAYRFITDLGHSVHSQYCQDCGDRIDAPEPTTRH